MLDELRIVQTNRYIVIGPRQIKSEVDAIKNGKNLVKFTFGGRDMIDDVIDVLLSYLKHNADQEQFTQTCFFLKTCKYTYK